MGSQPQPTTRVLRKKSGMKASKDPSQTAENPISKKVSFSDDLVEIVTFHEEEMEREDTLTGPATVAEKRAARVLQQFARTHMLCWILLNERRSELYEELEDIQKCLEGDLQRVQWDKNDALDHARLQVQAELLSADQTHSADESQPPLMDNVTLVVQGKKELRELKAKNKTFLKECKHLKKRNKALLFELKQHQTPVSMKKHQVSQLKGQHKKLQTRAQQYQPLLEQWTTGVHQANGAAELERLEGRRYHTCIQRVASVLQEGDALQAVVLDICQDHSCAIPPNDMMMQVPPATTKQRPTRRSSDVPISRSTATVPNEQQRRSVRKTRTERELGAVLLSVPASS